MIFISQCETNILHQKCYSYLRQTFRYEIKFDIQYNLWMQDVWEIIQ